MKTSDIEVSYIQHCGDDLAVVNAARVSFHKESDWKVFSPDGSDPVYPGDPMDMRLKDSDTKLISYLARNKHFSPFNHSFITLRVKAPIFVARQLVKHKFMPWNEVSRRYVDDEPEFYIPEGFRQRAENVKQGSSDEFLEEFLLENGGKTTPHKYTKGMTKLTLTGYKILLAAGVAPEQARMILPQNMMTEWWWSGTLSAYCDMLRLRLDSHSQYESQIVANKVKSIIEPLFPVSVKALLPN